MEDCSAEAYLLNIPVWTRIKNSLPDVRAFLNEFGDPDESMNIIHVAGTNGKGSVCAFITSMLKEADYQVGTFVSPHLIEVRERFLLNGVMIGQADFNKAFDKVYQVTRKMMDKGYVHPSFFEFLFYMAIVLFSEKQVDYLVLETGLGGRIDTTNVITNPKAVVITSISLDHTEYLGDTIEAIAAEKAGIIKEGVPIIYDSGHWEAGQVIKDRADKLHCMTYPVDQNSLELSFAGEAGIQVSGHGQTGSPVDFFVPFAADYQAVNGMLAYRTLELIHPERMSVSMMKKGMKNTVWPGRMEQVMPGVYLDGAHNIGGVEAFTRAAGRLMEETGKSACFLFAAVSDKDYQSMAAHICRGLFLKRVTVAHIDNERALEEQSLAEVFRSLTDCPVDAFDCVESAVTSALKKKTGDDLLFCAGSLYLVGEILAVIRRNRI